MAIRRDPTPPSTSRSAPHRSKRRDPRRTSRGIIMAVLLGVLLWTTLIWGTIRVLRALL